MKFFATALAAFVASASAECSMDCFHDCVVDVMDGSAPQSTVQACTQEQCACKEVVAEKLHEVCENIKEQVHDKIEEFAHVHEDAVEAIQHWQSLTQAERDAAKAAFANVHADKIAEKLDDLHEMIEEDAQEQHAEIRETVAEAHKNIGKAQSAIEHFRNMTVEEKKAFAIEFVENHYTAFWVNELHFQLAL